METNQSGAPFTSANEFSVGSVLSRTFATFGKKPILFVGLTLMALIPATVITVLLLIGMATSSGGILAAAFIGVIITWILTLVFQAAISYGVFRVLRNEDTGFGNALSRGFATLGTLILLSILVGLCIGIGTIFLFIPGVIISCILAVAIPVCVVEKRGVTESMKRSAELTKGYRLKIFALFLIVGIVIYAINAIVGNLASSGLIGALITMIIVAIPQTYNSVMTAIIYYDLRAVKEGVSVDALANVFD